MGDNEKMIMLNNFELNTQIIVYFPPKLLIESFLGLNAWPQRNLENEVSRFRFVRIGQIRALTSDSATIGAQDKITYSAVDPLTIMTENSTL